MFARTRRMPSPRFKLRVPAAVAGVLGAAGVASLLVWPMPTALATTCVALGVLAGIVSVIWPRTVPAQWVAAAAMIAAVSLAPQMVRDASPAAWPWWQPGVLALAGQALLGGPVAIWRRRASRRAAT